MVPFEILSMVSYSPSVVTNIIIIIKYIYIAQDWEKLQMRYGHIFSHFRDMQRQIKIWPSNRGLGSFKVIENGAVWQIMYDFLLVRRCSYILYRFQLFDVE